MLMTSFTVTIATKNLHSDFVQRYQTFMVLLKQQLWLERGYNNEEAKHVVVTMKWRKRRVKQTSTP